MTPGRPHDLTKTGARAEVQRSQLQRVADALAWPLEPRAVATQLVEAARTALGAPRGWCAVRSEDGREAVILASLGYEPGTLEAWQRVPMDADVPMTVAIRTGSPVTHASSEDRVRDFPALAGAGVIRYVEASAVVPMVFEGATVGALAVTFDEVMDIDVSDRWFLETLASHGASALERARLFVAVGERDARLTMALEASGTWIWEWDRSTDRVTWTPEPPAFAGPVTDGSPPQSWMETVQPADRALVAATLEDILRGGGPHEVEFRVGPPAGPEYWLSGVGRSLPPSDGRPARVIGTIRDITEHKLAELGRNERIEAERAAARLRDAFIDVVSHELRTPITTIFGGTRVLSRRWRTMQPAARDALLADVSDEADRLFRMVEDLLVLTRVERGTIDVGDEPVAVRLVVERVVASERARSPKVRFETSIPAGLPTVQGDELYVEQILRNLLTNAAKYGGAASHVTVEAEALPGEVVLRVLDEGPGIAEGEAEQLFELFYRSPSTAPTVAGAGIGLFVCRQLALAMGGSIRAGRRPEGGAVFEVALRRSDLDDADAWPPSTGAIS